MKPKNNGLLTQQSTPGGEGFNALPTAFVCPAYFHCNRGDMRGKARPEELINSMEVTL